MTETATSTVKDKREISKNKTTRITLMSKKNNKTKTKEKKEKN